MIIRIKKQPLPLFRQGLLSLNVENLVKKRFKKEK